jgi:glycosyltransferase involved in cell wall biosynthesis
MLATPRIGGPQPTSPYRLPLVLTHLGLDLLFLVPDRSGGRETYVRELLQEVRAARPDLRITAFVNRETATRGEGSWSAEADTTVLLPRASARSRPAWAVAEIGALPRAAEGAGVDVLHSPANFGPWSGRFARVLTVHDTTHRDVPDATSRAARWGTEALMRPAMVRAHAVLTGSHTAAADIEALGVKAAKIQVAHHGVVPPVLGLDGTATRMSLGAECRVIALVVATHLPHKNLRRLLAGLARIPAPARPLLVLAGQGTDAPELAVLSSELDIASDVRGLGVQEPQALQRLFSAADLLVTATLQEGFGLTVVEGMAHGLPVAASDLPVLREVAGQCEVAWFDPMSPDAIGGAMRRLSNDPALRARLGAAGRNHAERFSWRASAAITLGAYDRALQVRALSLGVS